MEKDDEEETDASMNVTKYAIMPSLVALQSMRNRLHLAYLGRKLMKWTALATGKELRRLSMQMTALLVDYGVRVRDAYIKLARCRFHAPGLNIIILECCPNTARVTVQKSTRSVAGVKVLSLGPTESGPDGYSLVAVSRGGEILKETKRAWYELLKIMILICQYRITFTMVHNANTAATKKQNVLHRLIIPKINLTMRYILSELDEQEREETFRLKRFKQLKYKYDTSKYRKKLEEDTPPSRAKGEPIYPIELPKWEPPEPEPEPTNEELIIERINDVIGLAELIQNSALIQQNFGLTRCDLGKLKVQLHEMLKLSQTSKENRDCVTCLGSQCHCPASLNPAIPQKIENLEVIRPPCYEAALKLMPTDKVATPMPEYIMRPRGKPYYKPSTKIDPNERLNDLQNHVDQIICLTHCYKQDGLLSKSAEKFLKCCQTVKTKIVEIKRNTTVSAKINHLKWKIEHLEQVTDTIKKEGLTCDSISSFMSCCKDFKTKLESRQASKGLPSVCSIEKLIHRINASIELSNEAKMEGLITESLEEFIENCKEIKAKIDTQEAPKPKVINDLQGNLNEIMKCITKYKKDALLSDSIERFYTSCESTKAKLDDYSPPPGVLLDESQMTPVKRESRQPKKYEICPSCKKSPVDDTFGPIASRHGSQDKSSSPEDTHNDDTCDCGPLQESEPHPADTYSQSADTYSRSNEGKGFCKAKTYEDCPKCMKEQLSPACKTKAKSYTSKSPFQESALDPADTSNRGKKGKGFCKAKVYDDCPKCMKEPVRPACLAKYKANSSKTSVALSTDDSGTCKACSRIYTAVILPKSKSYSCKSSSSQSHVPELNISTCSQISAQQPSITCMQMQTSKSFQTMSLDKTKCKEFDNNKEQKGGGTVSVMILRKFKNIGNNVKHTNSVPKKPGSCESVKSTKTVCNAPTTKGFIQIVRNVKSEKLIRTQDLDSEPYSPGLWSYNSAETLTSRHRNNESNSAQLDPFFCCNSSTSHDNSGPVLPL